MNALILSMPRAPWIIGIMICLAVVAVLFVLEVFERRKPVAAKCQDGCSFCTRDPVPDGGDPRSRAKVALFRLEFALAQKKLTDVIRSLYEIDQCTMELIHAAGCAEGEQAFEDFAKACHAYARGERQKPDFPGDPVRTYA
ncbi:MAG TPA: hypothetical protein VLB83_01175 [Candidatus Paceibacterota bacterium]|nr:hypothetical protein [Candidatus Paceibacterota bacterium]